MSDVLKKEGHMVDVASDGKVALEMMQDGYGKYSLVLMVRREMSGLDVT